MWRIACGAAALVTVLGPIATLADATSFLDGAVNMEIPKGFSPMDADTVALKYPGDQPPEVVFTDATTKINIALGARPVGGAGVISAEVLATVAGSMEAEPTILEMETAELREVGGQQVMYLEFLSDALESSDYDIRNVMLMAQPGTDLIVLNLNCTTDLAEQCEGVKETVLGTLGFR